MSCFPKNKNSQEHPLTYLISLLSEYLLRIECACEGEDIQRRSDIAHMVRVAQRMAQRVDTLLICCGQKHCPRFNNQADDISDYDDSPDDSPDDSYDDSYDDHESSDANAQTRSDHSTAPNQNLHAWDDFNDC